MTHTIAEIAEALGAVAVGDTSLVVETAAEPTEASPDQIALAMDPKYAKKLSEGSARAAMMWADAPWEEHGLAAAILVPRPRFALSGMSAMFDPGPDYGTGIHPMAAIDPGAEIGPGATIGPFTWVQAGARIGANAKIGAQVVVGPDARLGDDVILDHGVKVLARCVLGNRVRVHGNTVIGGDGFSFVTPEASSVEAVKGTTKVSEPVKEQVWARIHSLAAVRIDDDVEIGVCTTIDRGTVSDTAIGRGTKVDNLVQVAHNVKIGEDCLICGATGIAGSTVIGNRVVLGGSAMVHDHIEIGDDVVVGGASLIRTSQPKGRAILGYPALPIEQSMELYKYTRRLPRMAREIAELREALSKAGEGD